MTSLVRKQIHNLRQLSTHRADVGHQRLFIWGRGDSGQLGLGSSALESQGAFLFNDGVKRFWAGPNHFFADDDRSAIWAWGRSDFLQTGVRGDKVFSPKKLTSEFLDTGRVKRTEENIRFTRGEEMPQVEHSILIHLIHPGELGIACGEDYSVASIDGHGLFAFGRNDHGQLGVEGEKMIPNPTRIDKISDKITKLSCGWGHTAGITERGDVWLWGSNRHSQCGRGEKTIKCPPVLLSKDTFGRSKVVQADCGSGHVLYRTEDGGVWLSGSAADGKGITHTEDLLTPQRLPFFDELDSPVVSTMSGVDHLGAMLENGEVYMWGFGQHGALGPALRKTIVIPQRIESSLLKGQTITRVYGSMDATIFLVSYQ
ncbi:hypothetical protein PROFUN_00583 [Planoprotostelium fungivorum]|uniref:Uncharacterized protein n=1 Tax=Planoprotostelium fungivorum TaxID=1890364 RepID=A0A2P6N175_9EUKA|nr:hypothetical protein PROFUN_00583 [Planoprotostelium fungivorum]